MRLIVEDRDGLAGDVYAYMQERADQGADGRLHLGGQLGEGSHGHVTILAIEVEDGRFGWLKGTVPGEAARALRQAAAVLAQDGSEFGSTWRAEVIEYLTRQVTQLEAEDRQLRSRT